MACLASAPVARAQQGSAAEPIINQAPPPEGAPAEPSASEQLAARQAALAAELEAMSAVLAAEREQRAEEVVALQERWEKAAAMVRENAETPPVTSARLGLGLTGFVQADWGAWRQSSEDQLSPSSGDPLNEQRFIIRRARLRATVERMWAAGALELDGNTVKGSTARIVGAEASLKWPPERGGGPPLVMATIGLFKIPFGFELLESDRQRPFLERSTAERALFPGEYDLGARLQGGWRFVRYALAVQNGDPLGERAFPGRDPNRAKDVSGRLGVDTPVGQGVVVAGGFSALSGTGFHAGTPATKPTLQWNDRNENGSFDSGEIATSPGMSATPSSNFDRFGYGADLRVAVHIPGLGTATAYGEIYFAKNLDRGILPADPAGPLGRAFREFGGYGAVTQEIGPRLLVGARYDYYDPDLDSTNRAMGALVPTSFAYQTLALVAALRAPAGRLIVEYDHNRNNNGLDGAGNPTNLADDAVTVRGEVSF